MEHSRLIKLLTLIFCLLIIIDVIEGQSKRRPSSRRRKPKPGQDKRLQCYTCYADFEKVSSSIFNPGNYIFNNLCYNIAQNYTAADAEFLTRCSTPTKYCMVDITRMNGVLLSVDRRCGGTTCRNTCLARGYGVIRDTCTFCCGGRFTEDDPEYDEEIHANYKCPIENYV